MRLVKKPSPSRTTTGVLSMAFRKSSARASVASDVSAVRITSTSGMRSTGEKKCRPSMQDGSGMALASSVIGMLEVLLAIGVPGRATAATFVSTSRLRSARSNTASTTISLVAIPS